jgi:hypothetical protein
VRQPGNELARVIGFAVGKDLGTLHHAEINALVNFQMRHGE